MKRIVFWHVAVIVCLFPQLLFAAENPCKEVYQLYEDACVGSVGFEESGGFSRAQQGTFNYYQNTINENNFWVYCHKATDKPVPFVAFKKDVCSKTAKNLAAGTQDASGKSLKTRHGDITIVKNNEDTYSVNFKGRSFPLGEDDAIDSASFDEKSYKVGNVNIFTIGWAVGNASQGCTFIVDKPDGLYVAGIDFFYIQRTSSKPGKISFEYSMQYKKIQIVEFDGNMLTTNFDWHNEKWVKRTIQLTKMN